MWGLRRIQPVALKLYLVYLNGDCRLVKRSIVKRWKKTTYRPSLIGPIPVGDEDGAATGRSLMFFLQLKPGSHWDLLMHFFLISWGSATHFKTWPAEYFGLYIGF